jgi:hypothetical protein
MVELSFISYIKLGPTPDDRRFMAEDIREYLNKHRVSWLDRVPNMPEYDQASGMIRGLWDRYHNLNVGACSSEMLETERDCPLVTEVLAPDKPFFDCSYIEWVKLFRDETRQYAATGTPWPAAEYRAPTRRDLDRDTLIVLARGTVVLKNGDRIERWGDMWAYATDSGYICDRDDPSYETLFLTEEPELTFTDPLEAYRACARVKALERVLERQREAAKVRLGRDFDKEPQPARTRVEKSKGKPPDADRDKRCEPGLN